MEQLAPSGGSLPSPTGSQNPPRSGLWSVTRLPLLPLSLGHKVSPAGIPCLVGLSVRRAIFLGVRHPPNQGLHHAGSQSQLPLPPDRGQHFVFCVTPDPLLGSQTTPDSSSKERRPNRSEDCHQREGHERLCQRFHGKCHLSGTWRPGCKNALSARIWQEQASVTGHLYDIKESPFHQVRNGLCDNGTECCSAPVVLAGSARPSSVE